VPENQFKKLLVRLSGENSSLMRITQNPNLTEKL
jgi:hypothetical protein